MTAHTEQLNNDQLEINSYNQMISYLEEMLTVQIQRLRSYDLDGALETAEGANDLVNRIKELEILKKPEFADERMKIERLYKELELIIETERKEVGDKLKQIRQGLKALGAYSGK